jgi:DNA-binding transcriptional ArsR family regulator
MPCAVYTFHGIYNRMDAFAVLSAPPRRQILDELRRSACNVTQLVDALAVNQPTVSKHLRVLRDAGFVSCRGDAQHRVYQLEPGPFKALDGWLAPYRRLWQRHLDALERFLDRNTKENRHETKRLPSRTTRRRQRARRG